MPKTELTLANKIFQISLEEAEEMIAKEQANIVYKALNKELTKFMTSSTQTTMDKSAYNKLLKD